MVLGKFIDIKYKTLFEEGVKHQSLAIKGSSISALYQLDKKLGLDEANKLDDKTKDLLANLLVKIYLTEKDKTQYEFLSKHLLEGIFSTDKATVELYTNVYNEIAKSNHKKAIQNLVNDFVSKGKQYKHYNLDKAAIYYFQQMIATQQTVNHPNKEELLMIIKNGMAELVD
jgi:regulatory protein YycI of two-component signal transduction system YycFG